ncbi:MAG: hypothetical protein P8Y67_14830 [Alphaproteobacteria bacterium]
MTTEQRVRIELAARERSPKIFVCARMATMTKLLDHAIDVVKRLPPERQKNVAEAMLALAESETRPAFYLPPKGDEPTEADILALVPTVMPSATPTKTEIAAWQRLSADEQLRRYREALHHPDADTVSNLTTDDILALARQDLVDGNA